MKKIDTIASLIQSFLLICILIFLFSCTQEKKQKANERILQDSLVYPHITILSNLPDSNKPNQILLEKSPKPISIKIPEKQKNSYSETSKIKATKLGGVPPQGSH